MLKEWVLPNASHPVLRLQIDWTPHGDSENGNAGGELVSPALELVAVAKELNKLDELVTATAVAQKEYPDLARAINAFEALLLLARGEQKPVADRLTKAIEFVKTQPAETPLHERYGEYLAAYVAIQHPATRVLARTLAQELVNDQQPPRRVNAEWTRRVARLRAMALWANDRANIGPTGANIPFGEGPRLEQWQVVAHPTAAERGDGMPAAAWKLKTGEARYLTGAAGDALYFGTPLAGDFEVKCQITTNGGRGIHLLYGGVGLRLVADGSGYVRQEVGRSPAAKTVLKEKIPDWKPSVEYRLVVKDSTMTMFVNGQQIHTEKLPLHPDPWLAIETNDGRQDRKSTRLNSSH